MKENLLLIAVLFLAFGSAKNSYCRENSRVENVASENILLSVSSSTIKPISSATKDNFYNRYAGKNDDVVSGDHISDSDTDDNVLYVPNSFTPNNDGLNDVFLVYGHGIRNFKLNIYSRWGDLLFSGDENSKGWNGCFKGTPCDQATYIYIVEYETNSGMKNKKTGHVTIVR